MKTEATAVDTIRHRLLEGVLLRTSRRPDGGDFILRGGVLLRHWFRAHGPGGRPRPALDLDLVATFPHGVEGVARRLDPVFRDDAVGDGVSFDADGVHAEGIWLETGSPGVRVFATGSAGGAEADFQVDVTFGPPPRPGPVFGAIPTGCGLAARVWMCRPETVVGQKLQALWHLGQGGWRPKDLEDLRRLLTEVPLAPDALRVAVRAYLGDLSRTRDDARALFGPSSWWGLKLSSARWLDFVKASPGQGVPRDLAAVVAAVAGRLAPVLEGVP